jgi:hypothetical protein
MAPMGDGGYSKPGRAPAQPLPRLGSYSVEERQWSNALPTAGVSPADLAEYWTKIVTAAVGERARRRVAAKEVDEARARGDAPLAGAVVSSRYTSKIEIKTTEAVLALLHEVIALEAEYLCDDCCAHVHAGATPEQAKRFLDSLDAQIASLHARHGKTDSGHVCYEDQLTELSVYVEWRRKFAIITPGASDAPLPASATIDDGAQQPNPQPPGESMEEAFALLPDEPPRGDGNELHRILADIIGPTREDRLQALMMLREAGPLPIAGLLEFEAQYRSDWHVRHPEYPFIESQRKAVQRTDFRSIVDTYVSRCATWDTHGLRPGSGSAIFTGLIQANDRTWKSSLMVSGNGTNLIVRLTGIARLRKPTAAVFESFNTLARKYGYNAVLYSHGVANLSWASDVTPLGVERFEKELTQILRMAAKLAEALVRSHEHAAAHDGQLDLAAFIERECISELLH